MLHDLKRENTLPLGRLTFVGLQRLSFERRKPYSENETNNKQYKCDDEEWDCKRIGDKPEPYEHKQSQHYDDANVAEVVDGFGCEGHG